MKWLNFIVIIMYDKLALMESVCCYIHPFQANLDLFWFFLLDFRLDLQTRSWTHLIDRNFWQLSNCLWFDRLMKELNRFRTFLFQFFVFYFLFILDFPLNSEKNLNLGTAVYVFPSISDLFSYFSLSYLFCQPCPYLLCLFLPPCVCLKLSLKMLFLKVFILTPPCIMENRTFSIS